jgi:hypothetical protein
MADFDLSTQQISNRTFRDTISASSVNDAELNLKVTVDGLKTYIASALPGTAQASPLWQVKLIDTTTGTVITWANGNASFTNVATDLTALTYR